MFSHVRKGNPEYRLAAFVSATGSAGTIAAGDYLKSRHGSKIAAVEAIECPTMLCNGYNQRPVRPRTGLFCPSRSLVHVTDLRGDDEERHR